MVAAGVGITLLPNLAVQPPIAPSADIHLVPFRGDPPSRRIAMVWRKSSALAVFLKRLATIVRALPRELLDARASAPARKPRGAARN